MNEWFQRRLDIAGMTPESQSLATKYFWLFSTQTAHVQIVSTFLVLFLLDLLTFAELGLLLAIQFGLIALLDYPTGALADAVGHKTVLIFAYITYAIAILLLLTADSWIAAHGINRLAIEDLQFSKRFGACRQFNRVKANFVYRQLLTTIYAQALKKDLAMKEVNPAFTSIIGDFKYARMYGLNGHQAAALVIGRRGLGFSEKLHGYAHHSLVRLVVPPMEGWSGKQITAFTRNIAGFTARLGIPTAPKSQGFPSTTPGRRQGSGGGIVPRSYTSTPGKGAPASSKEQLALTTTT
ncbi:MAG: hypothetical protein ACE5OZ_16290 [Candidatus Heimdallarchaeota archaeon]